MGSCMSAPVNSPSHRRDTHVHTASSAPRQQTGTGMSPAVSVQPIPETIRAARERNHGISGEFAMFVLSVHATASRLRDIMGQDPEYLQSQWNLFRMSAMPGALRLNNAFTDIRTPDLRGSGQFDVMDQMTAETIDTVNDLMIDFGIAGGLKDGSLDCGKLCEFLNAMEKMIFDQAIGQDAADSGLGAITYERRPLKSFLFPCGDAAYTIPITKYAASGMDDLQAASVSVMEEAAAEAVEACLLQLAGDEKERFPYIVGDMDISFYFMISGSSTQQQSIWTFDPGTRKHSITIYFKADTRNMPIGTNAFTDYSGELGAAVKERGGAAEMPDASRRTIINSAPFRAYARDVATHEMGHCLHAILHAPQFRMISIPQNSTAINTLNLPASIMEILLNHFGAKGAYACSNRLETVAELYLLQMCYPEKFSEIDEQDQKTLLAWYRLNGGPGVAPPVPAASPSR